MIFAQASQDSEQTHDCAGLGRPIFDYCQSYLRVGHQLDVRLFGLSEESANT
jgi:hypothetical protein